MSTLNLTLESGDVFSGKNFGHLLTKETPLLGEVVFNTGLTGYQEVLSDPSYCDQIITMTYPLIGNYGVARDDFESSLPYLKAFVTRENCEAPSNWRSQKTIDQLLKEYHIPGLAGIDTRMLTKSIREKGVMKGVLATPDTPEATIKKLLQEILPTNQVARVSLIRPSHHPGTGKRVVLVDFGFKKNILISLLKRNCDVVVVPWNSTFKDIERHNPDGILLSNGPGDPKSLEEVLPTIRQLQEHYPLYAICMGHQVFALANGADTEKMKFGHRGANHPVKDLTRDRVYITSQNHGYTVKTAGIEKTDLEITQVNLNDQTVEGLRHKKFNALSVQYHPEANPGPEDTQWFFDEFVELLERGAHAQK